MNLRNIYNMIPSSATPRFASVLTHSDNKRICGFALGYA